MNYLLKTGRAFFGIGIVGLGIQQFIYSDFRPVFLAFWPSGVGGLSPAAYVVGALLILAGAIIIFSEKAKMVSLVLGLFFFLLFLCSHVYYQLFLSPYDFHLGSWTNALKELTFSGGALIMAASYPGERPGLSNRLLLSIGRIFFAILLISFGIDHFLYTEFVATLVPNWIPGHTFWTYFGGIALIGSGVGILLKIKIELISLLLGIMLFIWFVILHIPRALVAPATDKGNELTSVFEALAYSGIAFVIACLSKPAEKEVSV